MILQARQRAFDKKIHAMAWIFSGQLTHPQMHDP
ncbi:hypothetical protein LECLMA074M_17160 [Leclercia sp. M-A074-M]